MNQDIKQRWVSALRSGEFEQGTDNLRKGDKFCCLGVLCELAVQDGVINPPELSWESTEIYGYGKSEEQEYANTGELPEVVAKWAGLVDEDILDEFSDEPIADLDPYISFDGSSKTLSELNDSGKTFIELAELIEEKL